MDVTDRQILEFEQRFYLHYGAKVSAIREELGLSDVRFFQRLNAAIDKPEVAAEFPALVNRLRRIRELRSSARRAS